MSLVVVDRTANKKFRRELAMQAEEDTTFYKGLRKKQKTEFIRAWRKDPTWNFVQVFRTRNYKQEP